MSILALQNTLIMVNSKDDGLGMLPLTAGTSALVWGAVLLLSVGTILRGIRRIQKNETVRSVSNINVERSATPFLWSAVRG